MKKALFLDRDGVINHDKGYVCKQENFELVDGILEVLRYFQEKDYILIVVTNQAGIGRGYYSETDFIAFNEWMINRLEQEGIAINKTYYDPYHPVFGVGSYKKESENRKPNPGMLLMAAQEFDIDMTKSVMIGDKDSDMEAALRAGVKERILYSSEPSKLNTKCATRIIKSLIELMNYGEKDVIF